MIQRHSHTRVTLALDIIRRIDSGALEGFHELGIVKHQIELCDDLAADHAPQTSIECDDPAVPLDSSNICWKAVELIRAEYGIKEHARIMIRKRIPVMGGLAGGSANAATTLSLLSDLWDLRLKLADFTRLGRKLGMDVPFYFVGGTAFDTETTGVLEPIASDLHLTFVLAVPPFGVSTRDAYARLDYGATGRQSGATAALRQALGANNLQAVAAHMHNDFELSVFPRYPELGEIKQQLLGAGCLGAIMSGSGSTLLGLCPDRETADRVSRQVNCRTLISSTYIP